MSIDEWVSKNAPQPVVTVLRPLYSSYKYIKKEIISFADSRRLLGPEDVYDEQYYSNRRDEPWRSDAEEVSRSIDNYFHPESAIDFGCAIGAHLEFFYHQGKEVKGIEGNPKAVNHAVIPEEYIINHDLRDPWSPERDYDVALCFEVAEHLPENSAGQLVDTLVAASDTVILTAATPGQGGVHHINEQPNSYWHQKFESRGYMYDGEATMALTENMDLKHTTWIQENLMVFQSKNNWA